MKRGGGSAGSVDAVILRRPEPRDGGGKEAGQRHVGGRDRNEAALGGELARLRVRLRHPHRRFLWIEPAS